MGLCLVFGAFTAGLKLPRPASYAENSSCDFMMLRVGAGPSSGLSAYLQSTPLRSPRTRKRMTCEETAENKFLSLFAMRR